MNHASDIRRQTLLVAQRFEVQRVSYQLPEGSVVSKDIIRHPGAVVIIPVLGDGRICLIRNFRIAVGKELIELPAGTLDRDEPPIDTARRELIEETGYRCQQLEPLCQFYMSPGILDERMHIFVASGLTAGQPEREQGEQIDNLPVTGEELDRMLTAGEIEDAKSLAALLFYLRTR